MASKGIKMSTTERLTAEQARKMADNSKERLHKTVAHILSEIRWEAIKGSTEMFYRNYPFQQHYEIGHTFKVVQVNDLIKNVIGELTSLGFRANMVQDGEDYVPLGLRNDDGSGPKYRRTSLKISWK